MMNSSKFFLLRKFLIKLNSLIIFLLKTSNGKFSLLLPFDSFQFYSLQIEFLSSSKSFPLLFLSLGIFLCKTPFQNFQLYQQSFFHSFLVRKHLIIFPKSISYTLSPRKKPCSFQNFNFLCNFRPNNSNITYLSIGPL